VIRIFTLDEFDPALLKQLTKSLYTAFGVGSEHSGNVTAPHGQQEPYDATKLLETLPKVHALADDKVLFLTARKLAPRKLASGEAPTFGLARYGQQRAVVTTSSIKNVAENVPLLARYAMQEVGHTYGLHHCLDPRCSMYPQWTPSYAEGEAIFCTFCRDSVDAKIRTTKS
jgi:predicted Zn-dependent protease